MIKIPKTYYIFLRWMIASKIIGNEIMEIYASAWAHQNPYTRWNLLFYW